MMTDRVGRAAMPSNFAARTILIIRVEFGKSDGVPVGQAAPAVGTSGMHNINYKS